VPRLAEMRKQLLIPRTESQGVPEANCDARQPDGVAVRGGGLDDQQSEAGESLFRHGEPPLVDVVTTGEIAASPSTSGG
jgi:hypothetical protein